MKKWLAYIAYVIIIVAAFLYILFPSADIKNYIIQQTKQISPAVSVAIGNVKPRFPPGLKFSNLHISLRNQSVFNASEINVTPKYLSMLSDNKTFLLKGNVYEGTFDGKASVESSSKPEYSSEFTFDGVQIKNIQALKKLLPHEHEIFGAADGSIQYSTKKGFWGNGGAEVTITGCRLELKPPIFEFKDLALGEVNAMIEFQNRQASIKEITVNGKQLTGKASGTIRLRRQLTESKIQLNGTIKPHPSLIKELGQSVPSQLLSKRNYKDNGISFRISGTLEQPNFSLR